MTKDPEMTKKDTKYFVKTLYSIYMKNMNKHDIIPL